MRVSQAVMIRDQSEYNGSVGQIVLLANGEALVNIGDGVPMWCALETLVPLD